MISCITFLFTASIQLRTRARPLVEIWGVRCALHRPWRNVRDGDQELGGFIITSFAFAATDVFVSTLFYHSHLTFRLRNPVRLTVVFAFVFALLAFVSVPVLLFSCVCPSVVVNIVTAQSTRQEPWSPRGERGKIKGGMRITKFSTASQIWCGCGSRPHPRQAWPRVFPLFVSLTVVPITQQPSYVSTLFQSGHECLL